MAKKPATNNKYGIPNVSFGNPGFSLGNPRVGGVKDTGASTGDTAKKNTKQPVQPRKSTAKRAAKGV